MNIAAILREVGAEIEKLQIIRLVLSQLSPIRKPIAGTSKPSRRTRSSPSPVPQRRNLPRNEPAALSPTRASEIHVNTVATPVPALIVLAPKKKRDKRPRSTPQTVPKALSSTFPTRPVFVAKALPVSSERRTPDTFDPVALETGLRRSLFLGNIRRF